jgi:hypothetical protein
MKSRLSFLTSGLTFIIFLVICGYSIVDAVQFDRNCEGHLKRAADANSIELAQTELQIAIDYIEKNDLDTGYTSVLYTTPDEDMGFWAKNLNQANNELLAMIATDTSTNLEKSNMLIKLRETLLDHKGGDTGDSVTVPAGTSRYPNNASYLWLCLSFGLACPLFAIMGLVIDDY